MFIIDNEITTTLDTYHLSSSFLGEIKENLERWSEKSFNTSDLDRVFKDKVKPNNKLSFNRLFHHISIVDVSHDRCDNLINPVKESVVGVIMTPLDILNSIAISIIFNIQDKKRNNIINLLERKLLNLVPLSKEVREQFSNCLVVHPIVNDSKLHSLLLTYLAIFANKKVSYSRIKEETKYLFSGTVNLDGYVYIISSNPFMEVKDESFYEVIDSIINSFDSENLVNDLLMGIKKKNKILLLTSALLDYIIPTVPTNTNLDLDIYNKENTTSLSLNEIKSRVKKLGINNSYIVNRLSALVELQLSCTDELKINCKDMIEVMAIFLEQSESTFTTGVNLTDSEYEEAFLSYIKTSTRIESFCRDNRLSSYTRLQIIRYLIFHISMQSHKIKSLNKYLFELEMIGVDESRKYVEEIYNKNISINNLKEDIEAYKNKDKDEELVLEINKLKLRINDLVRKLDKSREEVVELNIKNKNLKEEIVNLNDNYDKMAISYYSESEDKEDIILTKLNVIIVCNIAYTKYLDSIKGLFKNCTIIDIDKQSKFSNYSDSVDYVIVQSSRISHSKYWFLTNKYGKSIIEVRNDNAISWLNKIIKE